LRALTALRPAGGWRASRADVATCRRGDLNVIAPHRLRTSDDHRAQHQRSTERRPRDTAWEFRRHGGAAIGEPRAKR
jgi:hypothetical protein